VRTRRDAAAADQKVASRPGDDFKRSGRTRVYRTDRDIQRGVLAGFSFKNVSLTGYVFNPDEDKPTFVLAVSSAMSG
jgi:hypothetical protein